jgi:hypothetical protein
MKKEHLPRFIGIWTDFPSATRAMVKDMPWHIWIYVPFAVLALLAITPVIIITDIVDALFWLAHL